MEAGTDVEVWHRLLTVVLMRYAVYGPDRGCAATRLRSWTVMRCSRRCIWRRGGSSPLSPYAMFAIFLCNARYLC